MKKFTRAKDQRKNNIQHNNNKPMPTWFWEMVTWFWKKWFQEITF